MKSCADVEKSIITTYRKGIWSKFIQAIKEYELIQPNDKIAVCISGGKDSMLLAKCMQELQRHGQIPFAVQFLVMDPGYNTENRACIEKNAEQLQIPVHIFNTDIYDTVFQIAKSPCYLCARMRRGYLYKEAEKLGCNKIALGHHFNDVIETILMGVLYGGQMQSMPPKLKSTNHKGMQLIRPLYYVHEQDIINWKNYNELVFMACGCRFTEYCSVDSVQSDDESGSKRAEMKRLIAKLKEKHPNVDVSIFRSAYNVHVDTLIKYDTKGKEFDFLSRFNQEEKS